MELTHFPVLTLKVQGTYYITTWQQQVTGWIMELDYDEGRVLNCCQSLFFKKRQKVLFCVVEGHFPNVSQTALQFTETATASPKQEDNLSTEVILVIKPI